MDLSVINCKRAGMDRGWTLLIFMEDKNISWQIAFLNLLGSIAFGISAIAAFVLPLTGQPISSTLVNLGTFTGAICFLIGAILLLPERTHPD